jgi:cysteine desulfurase
LYGALTERLGKTLRVVKFLNVYLDYAATTPADERVVARMTACLGRDGIFANPSSGVHAFGFAAETAVEEGRAEIANNLNCQPSELVFTSGATEADNLAILGCALAAKGGRIVTVATEHKAVLAACDAAEARGFSVSRIRPDATGVIDPQVVASEITNDTLLVSVMHVNNETGVIQDIEAIGHIARRAGAIFHVDAAQSVGKIRLDLSSLPVDLMSISGHKIYGPKGIGALFIRRPVQKLIAPIMYGGGQEGGLRPGTLATHQIVGLAEAISVAHKRFEEDRDHIRRLSDRFLGSIGEVGEVAVNSDRSRSLPNILNISFSDVDAEALMANLPDLGVSSTSACTSGALEPSHVLRAMGVEGERLYGAIRFSFGRFTTEEEVDYAAGRVAAEVKRLRAMAAA